VNDDYAETSSRNVRTIKLKNFKRSCLITPQDIDVIEDEEIGTTTMLKNNCRVMSDGVMDGGAGESFLEGTAPNGASNIIC
jgi:hypothetical protein